MIIYTSKDPHDLNWDEENPQRILIPIQFKRYQNPGNEEHIKQVLLNYLKPKGIDIREESGSLVIYV